MAQVVEDEERIGEEEDRVREAEIVLGAARQALHVSNHVVGEEADGAPLEPWKARHGYRLNPAEEIADGVERVAVGQALRMPVGVAQRQAAVLCGQDHSRLGPEERVAGPRLAAFDRLEQEGVRTWTQPQVGGQRRVEIGGQLGEDGHEIAPSREVPKFLTRR
jgi:hypothetical protein